MSSPAELRAAAVARSGLEDFGDENFAEGLGVLVDSLDAEAELTPAGVARFDGLLISALTARLRTQHWSTAGAGGSVEVHAPIFITGLPRSGTTLLHRLLCADANHQGMAYWLTVDPRPRPPQDQWEHFPAYREVAAQLQRRQQQDASLQNIHELGAGMVEECWRLEMQSLRSTCFENMAVVPTYHDWLRTVGLQPTYQWHRRVLSVVGSAEPDRRWVLKNPSHIFSLEALLAVYPDATIIQTHRDPRKVLPSISSLNVRSQSGTSPLWTPESTGRQALDLWSEAARKGTRFRAETTHQQFIDVFFADLERDPVGVVQTVYDALGMAMPTTVATAAAQARANRVAASQEHNTHQRHHYALPEYGLNEAEVEAAFADYLAARPEVWDGV